MIQPKVAPPQERVPPQRRIPKHARRRRRSVRLAHYSSTVRVLGALVAVLAPVMIYVMLTSNLTSLNYALAAAETQRAQLQQEVQRQDDQIAHLDSRERLAQVAAKLGMRDPLHYEIVSLAPPETKKPFGIAFLGWLSLGSARDRLRK
jgi:cell division protein FtsL